MAELPAPTLEAPPTVVDVELLPPLEDVPPDAPVPDTTPGLPTPVVPVMPLFAAPVPGAPVPVEFVPLMPLLDMPVLDAPLPLVPGAGADVTPPDAPAPLASGPPVEVEPDIGLLVVEGLAVLVFSVLESLVFEPPRLADELDVPLMPPAFGEDTVPEGDEVVADAPGDAVSSEPELGAVVEDDVDCASAPVALSKAMAVAASNDGIMWKLPKTVQIVRFAWTNVLRDHRFLRAGYDTETPEHGERSRGPLRCPAAAAVRRPWKTGCPRRRKSAC